jgi:hypothetical protein
MDTPQVVRFSNEDARKFADVLAGGYVRAKSYLAKWQNVASLTPDDDTVIDDGSAQDGRTPITGHDLHRMAAIAIKVISMAETPNQDGSADISTISRVQVNGF